MRKNITRNLLTIVPATLFLSACNLSVSIDGVGKVTTADSKINCGWESTRCNASYDNNETVVLEAQAAPNFTFAGWTGVCEGQGEQCQVKTNSNHEVTAIFDFSADEPIPVDSLAFNSTSFSRCVSGTLAPDLLNTEVESLVCSSVSRSIQGVQQFPNLTSLRLSQHCFGFDLFGWPSDCIGTDVTEFSALENTQIEELIIAGGSWKQVFMGNGTRSPYKVETFSNIPTLKKLIVSGFTGTKLPDIAGLEQLEYFKIDNEISSLGALTEGAAPNLKTLVIESSKVPCSELEQALATHPELEINGYDRPTNCKS